MTSKACVMDFVNQRSLAVVGVAHSGRKFGSTAYRAPKAKRYHLDSFIHKRKRPKAARAPGTWAPSPARWAGWS